MTTCNRTPRRGVLITALALLTAVSAAAGAQAPRRLAGSTGDAATLRAQTIQEALTGRGVLDCTTPANRGLAPLGAEVPLVSTGRFERLTPEDGRDYTAAFWSPDGGAIVFVAPTAATRPLPPAAASSGANGDEPRLLAVSVNELWLYSLAGDTWELLTGDGASPRWSDDGQSLYYLSAGRLLRHDRASGDSFDTGLRVPETTAGMLLAQPLADGRLLSPSAAGPRLSVQPAAGAARVSRDLPIALTERDRVLPAPRGERLVVAYGAGGSGDRFQPAVTVVHEAAGGAVPLLANCHASALQISWSPDGGRIAFPVSVPSSELRVWDAASGRTRVLVRLDSSEPLSSPSWSPDGRFVAYAQGDPRSGETAVWAAAADGSGRQKIAAGLLPSWSPAGNRLLLALPGSGQLLDWYLIDIETDLSK